MSTLSQFVNRSPIKSIQRGTITISSGAVSNTATISSVTTSKTQLNFLGSSTTADLSLYLAFTRVTLTNSTTVTATRGGAGGHDTTTVSYEVIEYN